MLINLRKGVFLARSWTRIFPGSAAQDKHDCSIDKISRSKRRFGSLTAEEEVNTHVIRSMNLVTMVSIRGFSLELDKFSKLKTYSAQKGSTIGFQRLIKLKSQRSTFEWEHKFQIKKERPEK